MPRGFSLNEIEDAVHRGFREVGQVDRDLHEIAVFHSHAHRLDVPEAAAAVADRRSNLLRHIEPVGIQVDVVGNERHARADHGRTGRGMWARWAVVWYPSGRRELCSQPLELAATDVLEVLPQRIAR